MPQKVYLDDQGNPLGTATGQYLTDTGEPAAPSMNFATVNGQRVPVEEDGPRQAVEGFAQNVNPVPMLVQVGNALMSGARGAGRMLTGINPEGAVQDFQQAAEPVKGLLKAQGDLFFKGRQAAEQGDYITAARHLVDWLIPVLGPAIDDAADEYRAGRPWAGSGKTAGILTGLVGPKAIEAAGTVKLPAALKNKNPVEADALAFAEREGIPVDAGTATGNLFVRGAQAISDRTPLGAVAAETGRAQRVDALRATGERLAARVHPDAVTPETAGQAVRGAVQGVIDENVNKANQAYDRLRQIEANTTAEVEMGPPDLSPRAKRGMVREFGKELTPEELSEVRRIRAELDAQQFQAGKLVQERLDDSETYYARGQANAAVYHDIRQLAPGTSEMTGAQMIDQIDQALTDGRWTNAARGAVEVARARLGGKTYVRGHRLNKPLLPPGAGDVPPDLVQMNMPVDLRTAKKMLKPLYDRLNDSLPPALKSADEGFFALKNIMEWPDHAQASKVDAALSAIKGMARSDTPGMRSVSEGLSAQAVKVLEQAVQKAVEQGGPEAVKARATGQLATQTKYQAADVLKQISKEPVQAFRQMVYSKDAGIAQLRQVADLAGAELPKIGRAFIEDLLSTATEKGGFDKGATIFNKWASLGPETRQLLFSETAPDLNRFFLLAERLAKVTNPSESAVVGVGTAGTIGLLWSEPATGMVVTLGGGALSKVLRNPKAVKLLTKGMQLSAGPAKTSAAARVSAAASFAEAARAAGVRVQPAAGNEGDSTRPQ